MISVDFELKMYSNVIRTPSICTKNCTHPPTCLLFVLFKMACIHDGVSPFPKTMILTF